jgi:hypothetical protein
VEGSIERQRWAESNFKPGLLTSDLPHPAVPSVMERAIRSVLTSEKDNSTR